MTARGKIIGMDQDRAPVYEFQDQSGELQIVRGNIVLPFNLYKVGQEVEVLYPKDDPLRACVNDFLSVWTGVCVLGLLAAVFFVEAALLFGGVKWRKVPVHHDA